MSTWREIRDERVQGDLEREARIEAERKRLEHETFLARLEDSMERNSEVLERLAHADDA